MYSEVIQHYGLENQTDMLMEECAELIQAANKMKRYPEDHEARRNLIEEIVDVEIMIAQMKIGYKITREEITSLRTQKDNRLFKRLWEEKAE